MSGLINEAGTIVRMPIKGRDGLVDIKSRDLNGELSASGPSDIDPSEFHLAVLAMQEPQYRSPDVRDLINKIGKATKPGHFKIQMPEFKKFLTSIF